MAGVASTWPSGAVARTANRYLPGFRRSVFGEVQALKPALERTRQV